MTLSLAAIITLSYVAFFAIPSFAPNDFTSTQLANIEMLANIEGGCVTMLGCNPKSCKLLCFQ